MTDRLHSCRESPDGRHVGLGRCSYCLKELQTPRRKALPIDDATFKKLKRAGFSPMRGRHALSCPAYGNYQPPYEDCTCGAER